MRRPQSSTLFPSTTLSRSLLRATTASSPKQPKIPAVIPGTRPGTTPKYSFLQLRPCNVQPLVPYDALHDTPLAGQELQRDRKSTRLNSSHANISYAVFCLK